MAFTRRSMTRSGSTATPTTPSSNRNSQSSTAADPEWNAVLEIKEDCVKAWKLGAIPEPVQDAELGFFMSDEVYVVLKVSNHQKKLIYDLYFWIGKGKINQIGTQPPEKVAQLMALLGDKVVIHRVIEGSEDRSFKALFKDFGVLSGNSSSLFNPDHPEAYKPRLLHFCLNKDKSRTEVSEVPISRKSLNSGDVYIVDEGNKMTQWNGSRCDEEERQSARRYMDNALRNRKMKCTSEFFDEEDLLEKNELYDKLGNRDVPAAPPKLAKSSFVKKLLRLSDETNKLVLTPVYSNKIFRNGINPDDVTFIDTHKEFFVYIGPGANNNERASVWTEADKYLKAANTPNKAISVFNAGCFCNGFEELWDDLRN